MLALLAEPAIQMTARAVAAVHAAAAVHAVHVVAAVRAVAAVHAEVPAGHVMGLQVNAKSARCGHQMLMLGSCHLQSTSP